MNDQATRFLEAVKSNNTAIMRSLEADCVAITSGARRQELEDAFLESLQQPNIEAFRALVDFLTTAQTNAERSSQRNRFFLDFYQFDGEFIKTNPDFATDAIHYLMGNDTKIDFYFEELFLQVICSGHADLAKAMYQYATKHGIDINIEGLKTNVIESNNALAIRSLSAIGFPPNGNDFRAAIRQLNCERAGEIAEVWDKRDLYYGNWLLEIPCHRPLDVPKAKQMFDILLEKGANPYRFDDKGIGVLKKHHSNSAADFTNYLQTKGCFISVEDPIVFSAEDIETANAIRLVSGAAVKGAPLPLFEKIAYICKTDIKGLFTSLPHYVQEHPGLVGIKQHLEKARAAEETGLNDLASFAKQKKQKVE